MPDEFNEDFETPRKRPSLKLTVGFIWLIVLVIIAVYFLSGFFLVGPAEIGLVKRFGAYRVSVGPGLHYHLPAPIESVVKVNTSALRKEEIGFRTITAGSYRSYEDEALMLTNDGNIVYVEAVVQYYVLNPEKFAFNLVDPSIIVRFTTEAVMREEVAAVGINDILTVQRESISNKAAERIREELEKINAGIAVKNVYLQEVSPPSQVIAAFDDVNNAKQDKQKLINEAEEYKNDVVPKAEGNAAKMLREAEAYAQEKYLKAFGQAERFKSILREYEKAPEITKKRLYLEMLNNVLSSSEKYVITGDSGVLKLLNLPLMEGGK
ncbi:MAG: FtsH protease activity modulator HflK [Thermotogae bacterium]|uniref:FtsH protease activity modulator HflK n=1 Tax=Kosmotoga sp. TaxID=1955248 RepID=UPI000F1D2B00|nr:FtsH protease activity modulator HflK [Kosmotoga sp.]MBO8166117.1 FtsH protease activity modulator HflK [Kosmotoga sp.]MCD6159243.1 FtsH protease activity modulator HflK [Kosmotoga sp.]RKX50390.1 MAG: FtsH protease activity modulator HflK [Thermotogota bacterium]